MFSPSAHSLPDHSHISLRRETSACRKGNKAPLLEKALSFPRVKGLRGRRWLQLGRRSFFFDITGILENGSLSLNVCNQKVLSCTAFHLQGCLIQPHVANAHELCINQHWSVSTSFKANPRVDMIGKNQVALFSLHFTAPIQMRRKNPMLFLETWEKGKIVKYTL